MHFLQEFHEHGVFPRGSNSSFIALVHKVEDPQNLSDFRLISLVGCMYKVATKPKRCFFRLLIISKVFS